MTSSSSLGELMATAETLIAAGVALSEQDVLMLARELVAAAAHDAEAGQMTVEIFQVPETLVKLRSLIGD